MKRSLGVTAAALLLVLPLSGCIQARLKRLEIRQLETQVAGMKSTAEFLRGAPQLGGAYGGRLFVSGSVLNRFLDGLANYEIPLDKPRGSKLTIERTQLVFADGPPQIDIAVKARDRSGSVEVRLRMRADLVMSADPSTSALAVRLEVREVAPEVKLSIFRLRELFFVAGLLRLEAQKYLDALPSLEMPLQLDLPLAFDPPSRSEMALGSHAKLFVRQKLPSFDLAYRYRAKQVIALADGIHVFFDLEAVK